MTRNTRPAKGYTAIHLLLSSAISIGCFWCIHQYLVQQLGVSSQCSSPSSSSEASGLAVRESAGFFDEPDEVWLMRKEVHDLQMRLQAREIKRLSFGDTAGSPKGHMWWQFHYEPSFSCTFERRIGRFGDGGKWVCDPYKITKRANETGECLVYSVGSSGDYSFEEAVYQQISPLCEIHTFDMENWTRYTDKPPPDYLHYHIIEVGVEPPALTMLQIVKQLGHESRRIDLLKMDCEGCEWSTFSGWLGKGVNIRQILVELHWRGWTDKMHSFYRFLFDHGYVVFHKESNSLVRGDCIEYGFLKLSKEFTAFPTHIVPINYVPNS